MHFKDAVSKGKNRERAREQQKDRGRVMMEKNSKYKRKRGKVQHIRGSPKKRKISGKAVFPQRVSQEKMLADVKNLITDKASELKRQIRKSCF